MRRFRRVIAKLWPLCLAALLGVLFLAARQGSGPSYDGRTANEWFEEYVSDGRHAFALGATSAREAFAGLGADALPFLLHELEAGAIRYQAWYRKAHARLPGLLARLLAQPVDSRSRRWASLELIALVVRTESGPLTGKGKAALDGIVSTLDRDFRKSLRNTVRISDDLEVLSAIDALGERAAPLLPVLTDLLEAAHARGFVDPFLLDALESIGTPANAAVPLLTRIALDRSCTNFAKAAATLPEVGAPASVACPILSQYVADWGVSRGIAFLLALARAGPPTDIALPRLRELRGPEHNSLIRGMATLALWHRDPDDEALSQDLRELLLEERSFVQGALLRPLQRHPDKAEPLADAIEQLASSADVPVSLAAADVLVAIRSRREPTGGD